MEMSLDKIVDTNFFVINCTF